MFCTRGQLLLETSKFQFYLCQSTICCQALHLLGRLTLTLQQLGDTFIRLLTSLAERLPTLLEFTRRCVL